MTAKPTDDDSRPDEAPPLLAYDGYGDNQFGWGKSCWQEMFGDPMRNTAKVRLELIALVPGQYKGAFGAAWVEKYVTDRLAPVAGELTPEQRTKLRELCAKEGETYANINNTPERSIKDVSTYQSVYEQVLTPEQQKRVEPK